ncbi:hypothetical protein MPRI_00070 [Mycobacterium paraintracellulare]|uniref:Ketopantoate reductase C-terminal domain-containing protein n=2 Tax=Mycobacterium paraintracellulare TaxID=1138383 RepID=A0ABM7K1J7_9MYCO|nr:hypothetical protein MPRI_00070 [Mycobacterium paraintracellulare]
MPGRRAGRGRPAPDGIADELTDLFRNAPEDMGTSILTDAENHRPMEWDVRNGVIIRKARAHGLPHRSATSWCRCWPRRATGRLD